MRTFKNPILPGFHPDPSICCVGDDFYLVTSTFEFFPGLPIFHSKNLVDWELIGHGLDRESQLQLSNENPNAFGLYAPTIRYINHRFYIVCTNVPHTGPGTGNFIIWTDDVNGTWSDPIWLDLPGIDPSLFVDDDGTVYYTGADVGIFLSKINLTTGETMERIDIWSGTGAADPEGPHIYKKNGYYYLMISEGGTSYGHMIVMARSQNILGPYEAFEGNPVLTNRSSSSTIQAIGHSDLVQDSNHNWWAVCLGIRPLAYPRAHLLGRETFLVPVQWEFDWPTFGEKGQVKEIMSGPLPGQEEDNSSEEQLDWLTLFGDQAPFVVEKPAGFELIASHHTLSDSQPMAWTGIRQQHLDFRFSATLVTPLVSGEFGITAFLNPTHHYEIYLDRNTNLSLNFRRQIGSLWKIEKTIPLVKEPKEITFILEGTPSTYEFSYQVDGKAPIVIGEGETHYLTTEVGGVFTGMMLGIYASNPLNDGSKLEIERIKYFGK